MNRTSSFGLVLLAAVFVFCTGSCSEPAASEKFVRNKDRDVYGRYVFDVNMNDSMKTYSMSLYAAFTCRDDRFMMFSSLPLNVMWESPRGAVYEENLMLDRSCVDRTSNFGKTLAVRYRTGIVPGESGIWNVYLTVPQDSVKKYGITGMGLKISKE